ncbi:SHOCT domain-containing protein [Candidatus Pacearchaeota archaeon]|nr:SHOCT domain-containing protein [Candidatus Pacearchaeota archaeon]
MTLCERLIGKPLGIGRIFGIHGYGWLFQLLILIAFILIVYWVLKGNKTKETAMDIVKKRYAKGEITDKEFLKLKKEIQ